MGGVVVLLSGISIACAPAGVARPPLFGHWQSPLGREHPLAGKVWDVARNVVVSEDDLLRAVAAAAFVGIGEQHDNVDHHVLQARLIEAVVANGRRPGVVFEMLDHDEEGAVRKAVEVHPRDPDAISTAVDWSHSGWPPWSTYRPIFSAAMSNELPLFAGGVDRKAAMRLAVAGPSAVPADLVEGYALGAALPNDVQEGLRREMRDAHCGMLPDSMLDSMVFVQRVRDATLADGLARAGSRGGVLIAGNGHVRNDRGVPALVRAHSGAVVLAVGLLEVQEGTRAGEYAAAFGVARLPFDYVVFTPRANDDDHCKEIAAHRKPAAGQ